MDVTWYIAKGKRTTCKNYRGIDLSRIVGKIYLGYLGILLDRVRRVTEGLINDEQGGFRSEKRYAD